MPRTIRDTPMPMPIGIAVAQASRKALNTRNIDQPKFVASGASADWPIADSYRRVATVSGVGRNSGGTQSRWLASHHRPRMTTIDRALYQELRPSPGAE